jgi:hypothetical protein
VLLTFLLACETAVLPDLRGTGQVCSGEPGGLAASGQALEPIVLDPLGEEPGLHLPDLVLQQVLDLAGDEASQRVPVAPERVTWSAAEAWVDLEGLGLASGLWQLESQDAYGRATLAEPGVLVLTPPLLDRLEPESVCHAAGPLEVYLSGSAFIVREGELPTVRVAGQPAQVASAEGCTVFDGGELCTGLWLSLDPGTLPLGDVEVEVDNPEDSSCGVSEPLRLEVTPSPQVTALSPPTVCVSGGEVEVQGEDFPLDARVFVDGVEVPTTRQDSSTLYAEVPALEAGDHSLEVSSPDGACVAELPGGLQVTEAPLVFSVDPPSVYAALPMTLTAWIADLSGELTDAWIEDEGGTRIEADWSWEPEDPSRLLIDLPELDNGVYTVQLDQDGGCEGQAAGSFTVTSRQDLSLEAVEPAQAWTFDRTPVEVQGAGLQDTPRLYLVGPGSTGATTPLLGVSFRDSEELAATLPEGLDVGVYSLLAVNPDGGLGVLWKSVEVLWDPPPTIEGVSPSALDKSSATTVTISGRDFRDPEVELTCSEGGVESSVSTTLLSSSYASVEVLVPSTSFNSGVCLVDLTNSDGTHARFAAISIRNPSQNLGDWSAGPELSVGRRALASAAGRTSSVNRWLYAIGGDDGSVAGARDDIEAARIGVYGDIESWRVLSSTLPKARTFAAAVALDNYVYLVGGHNGVQATTSTYRAQILDPLDAPLLEDVSVARGSDGLTVGTWSYRVAALFPEDDEVNPGGESLASAPMSLSLPEVEGALRPTLSWTPVARASGYRVYRSSTAGAAGSEWVADVTEASFTDEGGATDPSHLPLEEGALGSWARLANLTTEREGACLALAPDPQTDPEVWWLIAAGGRDLDGQALESIEALDVRISGPNSQEVGSWTVLDTELSEARSECSAFAVDSRFHSVVDRGETWVYFAGGRTDSNTSGVVDAGQLIAGGTFADWGRVDSISPARAGMVTGSAADYLHVFGGQKGEPSGGGVSAEITGPPDLRNWNSQGISLVEDRYQAGSAQESAILFAIGGQTSDEDASATTEWTNW